jgi:riboflavin synthase
MFTGIVEAPGKVLEVEQEAGNVHFRLFCPFRNELKVDQSLSHNGVCLTVCELGPDYYRVTAIAETLEKTSLGLLKPGDLVNLERCMPAHGRFDGHIVQGHVDTTGICFKIIEDEGSWRLWFRFAEAFGDLTVEKGSVCVNGVSLTVVESGRDFFSVAIIPYTWENTNLSSLKKGSVVNLEFDILGKYMRKMLASRQ